MKPDEIEVRTRRTPIIHDRWFVGTVGAVAGAIFMYVARQPEIDFLARKSQDVAVARTAPKANNKPSLLDQVKKDAEKAKSEADTTKPAEQKTDQDEKADAKVAVGPKTSDPKGQVPKPLSGSISPPVSPFGSGPVNVTPVGTLPGPGALSGRAPEEGGEAIPGLFLAGSGSESSFGALAALARRFGGGIKKYEEIAGRGRSNSGYIVWVPDKNAKAFRDKLKDSVTITNENQGSVSERNQLISETPRSSLARLQKQRSDLLLKYFEDAPSVKDVDDQIDAINKSIKSLHAPGAGYAVAKIEIN